MIRQDIDINGYWKVIILYNIYLGKKDSGFTHTDYNKKRSIVGISNTTDESQFFNTLVHELKHVQSHICKYYDVDEDSEDAAYLIGYLMQNIYPYIKNMI